jgi:sulfonate transport system permease protein
MRQKRFFFHYIMPWVLPLFLLVTWHVVTTKGIIGAQTFPQPLKVLDTLLTLLQTGELTQYIGDSAKRAFTGFLIGGGLGLALGMINGLSTTSEKLLDSSIQMVRNIPHLALIPLVILWFGIAEPAKLVLISLGVFFPIYLNTFHGIRSIDPTLTEMGRVYNLNKRALFWHVILPGSLPSILVGVRYSLGVMWLTLIVAETVAADSGIGFMAMNGREFMQMDVIVLSILIYAFLGKLSDTVAKWMEKSWLKWHPNFAKD